ncbi:MAG: glutathione-disulfide reductase [Alphaproteobacteria bacterium]|nr:glutathione-disulfide reductase [Hyphomicrobiales bacterium]PCI51221.1 MAG: glutathione-disulfide reductase [Alphaproteobacteria bacterium]
MYDYDFFVIGAGSGGVRASRMASTYGSKVGICEDYRVGGTCVIRGCVPKKLFVYASEYSSHFSDSKGFGWSGADQAFDWSTLIAAKDKEIDRLNGLYLQTLENHNVEVIQARGRLLDAHTIELSSAEGTRTVTADKILIATGSWPQMPDVPGIEHAITSNEAFHLEQLPKRMAIVGGGYIAVEFAGIFNGMGVEMHLLYRGVQILRGFDLDIAGKLNEEMGKKGVDVRVQTNVTEIIKTDDGLTLTLTDGSTLAVDAVMYATGRAPNSKNMGLEELGVDMEPGGAIIIDENYKTSVDNIFAVGDVTGKIQLTPVAIKEGAALAATQFNDTPTLVNYENIPTAVFSQPSLGTIGMTETQAVEKFGDDIQVFKSEYRSMKFTLSGRPERSLMKMIIQKSTDKVIGVHIIGPDSAEIVQGIAIAMKCGATKAQFDATVAVHPTSAEEFVLMK